MTTKTDVGVIEWAIDDDVLQLRQWGTDRVYLLPEGPGNAWDIGAALDCALRLVDESGRLSRHHARLEHETAGWLVRDLASKNGIRLDGARRAAVLLAPGVELGIGGLTLIAESPQLVELRIFLGRLLGWSPDRIESVDLALRAVRCAAARRTPLVLCGDRDLVPIAHSIHRHALGDDRPFILCDPRRRQAEATVRAVENVQPATAAMQAAHGGSLCVWIKHLPRDFEQVRTRWRAQSSRVQLVVCMHDPNDGLAFGSTRITIPPLETRRRELPRIIDDYAAEASASLAVRHRFTAQARAWIATHSAASLPEIEKGTRRILALRHTDGNVSAAAAMLGMSHVALRKWIGRRALPEPA
jgi:Inner membrane component of T3SS, cytoplasmic domain/Bacterial regulatory protein, Fis family